MAKLGPAGAPDSPRFRTYHVIFGHETVAGRAFDVVLIVAILVSVAAIMLDSVAGFAA